ncbi:hypothetical protein CHLNCDRAFT_56820 [Chlorella variabilis]|uniref:Glucosamine 6-phosphate N-acetyltransferase n=1 Tax=Chlorella variabilis TaxID=554065 RepID=E1Z6N2_CHLVA|nr:hypothetical protein CHLNCDRAFT_56820 [Chlorella variabilis]EFN58379.1 hypothetical protein CHLNCDRAFT_56820 [Chlorella variabilis]|eukprot:XP_005850481.1 hypothetical protein CHLNCDRAFT_56820 [Chlorella variabilis]
MSVAAPAAAKPAVTANTVTRDLELGDFNKGYLNLLSQLTKVGDYDEGTFTGKAWVEEQPGAFQGQCARLRPRPLSAMLLAARFEELSKMKDTYRVVVIEDLDKQQIIATATLVVELKFIRGCGKCGHIEDVVVDSTYRGLRLGLRELGCYKVILDCSEDNAPFYEKCGLIKKEVQMVKYL